MRVQNTPQREQLRNWIRHLFLHPIPLVQGWYRGHKRLGFPAWRYLAEHAAGRSTDLLVLTAARSIFDALCETGLGSEHISAAFKAYHR
jgi:hypothetical protein